jgi:HSP20 family molecular chaperone IbpA
MNFDNYENDKFHDILNRIEEQLRNLSAKSPEEMIGKIQDLMKSFGLDNFDPHFNSDGSMPPVGVFRFNITQDSHGNPKVDMDYNQVDDIKELNNLRNNMSANLKTHNFNNQSDLDEVHFEELDYGDYKLILIDLPGMKKEDLMVTVKKGKLDVFGICPDYEYSKQIDLEGLIEYNYKFLNGVLEIKIYK